MKQPLLLATSTLAIVAAFGQIGNAGGLDSTETKATQSSKTSSAPQKAAGGQFAMEIGGYFESQTAGTSSDYDASDDRLQTIDYGTPAAGANRFDQFVTYTLPGKDLSEADYTGVDIKRDAEIHFKPSITMDNGIRIGATIELEAASGGDQIDEAYLSVDGAFGRIVLGSENSARYLMQYAAPDVTFFGANSGDISSYIPISGSVGTIDNGTFDEEQKFQAGQETPSTLLYTQQLTQSTAQLPEYFLRAISTRFPNIDPNGAFVGDDFFRATLGSTYVENMANNDIERITWFSPRLSSGVQFGVSYARDNNEDNNDQVNINGEDLAHITDFGLNYVGTVGPVDLAVSGGYGIAFSDTVEGSGNPQVWNVGLNLGWKGWTIGGSFAEQNNSGCTLPEPNTMGVGRTSIQFGQDGRDHRTECDAGNLTHLDGTAYDVGVSYETGPWGFSFTYFHGENVDNEYNPDAQTYGVGHNQGTTSQNPPPSGGEFSDDTNRRINLFGDGEHRGHRGIDEIHTMFLIGLNYDLAKGVRLNAFGAYARFEEDTGDDGGRGEDADGFVIGTGLNVAF